MSRKPPPAGDASQGGKNEYIPSFISKKPFYISEETTDEDYLEHQRLQSAPQDTLDKAKWYDRGRKLGPAATKFRKGACENCGAMTHKTKECLSRPRKQGAKWTGKDIQADEVVEEVKLGWDAKRDRWNGYDAREYSAVVKEYEELEAIKKVAAGSADQKSQEDSEEENQNEDARYTEETDMGRSQPTSTRQLRLREDTAKYLVNLDLDSARYDPKTRSMDTSTQNLNDADPSSSLAEEGFTRPTSDAAEFERAQRYAWETQEKASATSRKLHLQANPTEGEVLRKKQTQEAAEKKAADRKALLEKYGGSEHLAAADAPIRQLQILENQRYVEYDESGAVKGAEKEVARSKYAEDVLVNNHSSTWGSWWSNFQWGYQCCHSFVKNSYCTGEEGRKAFEQAEQMRIGDLLLLEEKKDEEKEDEEKEDEEKEDEEKEDEEKEDEEKEDEEKEDEEKEEAGEQAEKPILEQDGDDVQERRDESMANAATKGETAATKKRTLQEMREGITAEEMEGYKRNRVAADDPMANLKIGHDGLVQ